MGSRPYVLAGARTTAQNVGAMQQQPPKPQGMQPISSQTSQLRNKFSQLTDLLQNTALQRGISLSEVAVPATRKPSKDQPKRSSLDEIRTNFRSFTQGSSSGAEGRSAPLRRVSTGAITPAFMKEKDRKDKALLESLGVADAGVKQEEDSVWQASSAQQPIASQPHQSSAGQQAQGDRQDRHSTHNTAASTQAHNDGGVNHSTGNGSGDAAHQTAGSSVTDMQSAIAPVEMSDIHLSSIAADSKGQNAAVHDKAPVAQTTAAHSLSKDFAASEDKGASFAAPKVSAPSVTAAGVHDADTHSQAVADGAANAQGQEGTVSVDSSRRPSWVTENSHTAAAEVHNHTAPEKQNANQPHPDVLNQTKKGGDKDIDTAQNIPAVMVDATLQQGTAVRAADAKGEADNAAILKGKPGNATDHDPKDRLDGAGDVETTQKSGVPLRNKGVGLWRRLFCCASQTRQ